MIATEIGIKSHYFLSSFIELCCTSNYFPLVQIVEGLPEGKGVQARVEIPRGRFVCNYGGDLLSRKEGISYMDRDGDFCFLYEFSYDQNGKNVIAFFNHNSTTFSVGKFINHSRPHFNVIPRVFFRSSGKPEIMFISTCLIEAGDQILFDYGRLYPGVKSCVSNCKKCKFLFPMK